MKEFFESVNKFLLDICTQVGEKVNLTPNIVAYIGLGLLAILVILIVVIIVSSAKKRKAKSNKAKEDRIEDEKPLVESNVESAPTQTEVVEEENISVEQEQVDQVQPEQPVENLDNKPKKKNTKKDNKDKPVKKLNGKWVIEKNTLNEFVSKLFASNGEVMLVSEIYSTEEGARKGIETIIKGIETGNFVIYQGKNNYYCYKLKTAQNRLLCTGENYSTNDQCLKAVESVKRIANSSPISEQVIEGNQCIVYTPSEIGNQNKTAKGKWKIEKTLEGKFVAKLFASNGQLMLATEEVVNKKNAENSIESVKKNSLEGNFIIEKDKFNKFYYKLRNAQKTVICVGETYEKLDSCISAIESVRYFAINSSLVSEKDAK